MVEHLGCELCVLQSPVAICSLPTTPRRVCGLNFDQSSHGCEILKASADGQTHGSCTVVRKRAVEVDRKISGCRRLNRGGGGKLWKSWEATTEH